MSNVSGVIKSIQDIMRKDVGVDGDAQRISHLVWMFFLTIYDDRESELELLEDGYQSHSQHRLGTAAMSFMREHGVLKDVFKETSNGNHRTSKGKKMVVHTSKAPGFGPKGVIRYVLPYTAFLKLKDIGGNVLPTYQETFMNVCMNEAQEEAYQHLSSHLTYELKQALAKGDKTLMGLVLTVLSTHVKLI